MKQELALEGGGGELVPWNQKDGAIRIDNAGAGDSGQLQQVVVGRKTQFEVRRTNSQIE
jgi:hypothetical protein